MLALGKGQWNEKENGNDGVGQQIGESWRSFHDLVKVLTSLPSFYFLGFCIIEKPLC